jgi:hypothetical protein
MAKLVLGLFGRAFAAADLLQLRGQHQPVELHHRQSQEQFDAAFEHAIGILESERDFGVRAGRGRRIGNAPMRGDRLAGPQGTGFAGGAVADGKNKIEFRRAGRGELAPGFRA